MPAGPTATKPVVIGPQDPPGSLPRTQVPRVLDCSMGLRGRVFDRPGDGSGNEITLKRRGRQVAFCPLSGDGVGNPGREVVSATQHRRPAQRTRYSVKSASFTSTAFFCTDATRFLAAGLRLVRLNDRNDLPGSSGSSLIRVD
jgi:hypothetical protein